VTKKLMGTNWHWDLAKRWVKVKLKGRGRRIRWRFQRHWDSKRPKGRGTPTDLKTRWVKETHLETEKQRDSRKPIR